MAMKQLTSEEIANTERKLDMPLDAIIKMSKDVSRKPKKNQRASNKSKQTFNTAVQEKNVKRRRYMESRPFVRQGFLAQRRTNFQANQFPLATEVAKKAAGASFRNRPFYHYGVANLNKRRAGGFNVESRATSGGNAAKSPQHQQPAASDVDTKERAKTLDSLFASMKEQRTKTFSQQSNAFPRNGNGGRPRVPWARGRFGK